MLLPTGKYGDAASILRLGHRDTTSAPVYCESLVIEILLNHYLKFTTFVPCSFDLNFKALNLTLYAAYFPGDDLHTLNACMSTV